MFYFVTEYFYSITGKTGESMSASLMKNWCVSVAFFLPHRNRVLTSGGQTVGRRSKSLSPRSHYHKLLHLPPHLSLHPQLHWLNTSKSLCAPLQTLLTMELFNTVLTLNRANQKFGLALQWLQRRPLMEVLPCASAGFPQCLGGGGGGPRGLVPCLLPIKHQQAVVLKNFWFPAHRVPNHHAHTLTSTLTNTLISLFWKVGD